MKYVIRIGAAIALLLIGAAGYVYYGLTHRPDIAAFVAGKPDTDVRSTSPLRVTFLGVSTLLFDDGETKILLDGFFTRPNSRQLFLEKIAPDKAVIKASLQRAGIDRLAAVIVNHSHYDHAMDAPEVALQTGALLVGSESTANVGRGWGMPEDRIAIRRPGDTMNFGRFKVTLLQSRHVPSPFTGGEITAPLVPPVHANAYREGTSFAVLIERDGKALLINASAGFVPGSFDGRHADVVFLGIGQLGKQSSSYMGAYWRELITQTGARRVVPIHWDDFNRPLDQPLQPIPILLDDMNTSMRFLTAEGAKAGVDVKLPEAWTAFDPLAGLPAPAR
ncbi:MAG: MBL fold metallo-hydrolase [Rhodopseudomonas sp.]|uniref:MBL fold metallo-hydrolase n=1 Tax=Rhodopseudomonas sp. TaxID=1078 RepID=UPI0017A32612|nr:MBL fold metallo-hydrolase [Rhodopseudomonas sp.]NVN85807.1 MBL fold metallo-hydrolase [Rhodopseudomonas sp.]